MSAFTDRMLLKFLDDAFVKDLLINDLGLATIFDLTYEVETIEIKEITLERIDRQEFQMPAFETIRTAGLEERITPAPERVKVNHEQSRLGRLEWVEVFLQASLSAKIHDTQAPVEKITSQDLLEKLGRPESIAELRSKLEALYSESIVDAFFNEFRITTVAEFKQRGNLFLEFIFKTPPPFDPDDPRNARSFAVNVCVKFQDVLEVAGTLQSTKLCCSILENEKNFAETIDGGEIKTPYVFAVIFPDSAVEDNAIPGLTADQIKASVKDLFAAEKMLVHFIAEP